MNPFTLKHQFTAKAFYCFFLITIYYGCSDKKEPESTTSPNRSINSGNTSTNTFIGKSAGEQNKAGTNNTFVGNNAGMKVTDESGLTFIGADAGSNHHNGFANTYVGYQSGLSDSTGYQNTFVGTWSGHENKTGFYNVFVGTGAGYNNIDGFANAYVGDDVGSGNKHGSENALLGTDAFLENEGSRNVGVGRSAATKCLMCDELIAIGYGAFTYSSGDHPVGEHTTKEDSSIAIGIYAGSGSNATHNFFAGHYSGIHNRTGKNIILFGHHSNVSKPGIENSIGIGNGVEVTKNNQLVIGSSTCPVDEIQLGVNGKSAPVLYGDKPGIGVGNTSPDYEVSLAKDGEKSLHFSAERNPKNPSAGSAVIFFDGKVIGSSTCPVDEIQLGVNGKSAPVLYGDKQGIGVGNTSPDYEVSLAKDGEKSLHFSAERNPKNPSAGSAVIFFDGNDLKVKNSQGVVKVIADF